MRNLVRWFIVPSLFAVALGTGSFPAAANHNADEHSDNLRKTVTLPKTGTVNSDMAFWGNRLYQGNYDGFRIIDISNPTNPTVVTDFVCPGPQNDVSVWDNDGDPQADLLFLSVDSPRTGTACGAGAARANNGGVFEPVADAGEWEGVRIIDINNEAAPVQIDTVPTDCGSHTHTLVPGQGADANNLYIYVSSYPLGLAAVTGETGAGDRTNGTECEEPEGAHAEYHNKISIIRVPLDNPTAWEVKEVPLDGRTEDTRYWIGSQNRWFDFTGCHDIAMFIELGVAGASCWEEGQLWDITDPWSPQFIRRTRMYDKVDTLFHSVTFSWDGKMMAWEDEAGGGGDDRCRSSNDQQGRMYFQDLDLNELGTFKIPRPQPVGEVCTAHNYNFVPQTNGRDILVSAWYQGGTSVADISQPSRAREIAFYDAHTPVPGGTDVLDSDVWSSYWYNGVIYASDIVRGLDVFQLTDPRIDATVSLPFLNPQTQMNLIAQDPPKCAGQPATILGSSLNDALQGTAGNDVILGLGGKDRIVGLSGRDIVCSGGGKDKVSGGGGKDLLRGQGGGDNLRGGGGADKLVGGGGRDRCHGGPGRDTARGCEVERQVP